MHHGAEDPRLEARVVSRRPLHYVEGPDEALDRPGHVRAGSGLAWVGERLVVAQDDASFLALIDPTTGRAAAVPLPAGEGGKRQFDDARGNKRFKLDLEACVVVEDERGAPVLLAFGSGSTERRDGVVVARGLDGPAPRVEVVRAPALYEALRAAAAFAGSELNLEGAALDGDDVVLFQRGNGAPRGGRLPVDATGRLDRAALLRHLADPSTPPPGLRDVTPWSLGAIDGVRLTFTDGAAGPGGLWFLAAAEASPDAYRDGPVTGVAVGVIEGGRARWARLRDAGGRLLVEKAEGLALDRRDPRRAWAVLDLDRPEAPSELCELALSGPWPT